ncbi:MAG: acyl-CoA thioesterase [Rhodobacteraceae bacterium]|nr:acyl-CoA thioesterase [Alphaproteobacteria bacterium]MBT8474237.1 acyl-CoA thioesterase [Alphaproteobacteria bacterium]NNF72004.1 acyl-CoA thioesterase [Paracoccaceae bacterium]NNK65940.1 acyl-CoA thioesterase [Paracoccaceae bacterium]
MTLVNRRDVFIEWGDCDPAGIVYYPRYFVFFDNATVSLFAAAGLPKHEMVKAYDIVGFPMVDTGARFSIPSKWGETITIESRISKWKRSSFDVAHRVLKGEDVAIEAWETRVWVGRHPDDPDRIKSQPIPEEVKARFA